MEQGNGHGQNHGKTEAGEQQLNRRGALRTLGLAAFGATAFSNVCARDDSSDGKGKAIVIGAGAAGLAAARSLKQAGFQVVVLEGRNRIGGRVWTDRSLGTPLDFGASWIHGTFLNPVTSIAKKNDIKTKKTNYGNLNVHDYNGSLVGASRLREIEKGMSDVMGEVQSLAGRVKRDISVQTAVNRVLAGEKLDAWERRALNWRLTTMEMNAAADMDQMSLIGYLSGSGLMGGDRLFPGGYDQVMNVLARGLDIRMNHTVRVIRRKKNGVIIETNRGSFRGDGAVVTLPLGVLRSGRVRFAPALPAYKRRAIGRMGMGLLNKVALRFDEAFWPTNRDFLGYMSRTRGEFATFMNWNYYTGRPYLLAFLAGRYARSIERLSDRAAGNRARAVLKRIYGSRTGKLIDAQASRWSRDPFAYGSYSFLPVGVSPKEHDALAEPVGRLFFAGEATNRKYPATVHGAYWSGIREAARIAAL